MKIIVDQPGQTCNRLWSYVSLVSEAITFKSKVTIFFFDKTINDFPNLLNSEYVIFPYYSKYLIKLLGIKKQMFLFQKLLFNRFTYTKTMNWWSKRGEIVNGWDYRGNNFDFEKNKKLIRHIFSPSDKILRRIDEKFSFLRAEYDEIIGVHIRRGDYATWLDGLYYFEIENYYESMVSYYDANKQKKQICFFISSDEDIDLGRFGELKCYKHENSSAILDLYSLAYCSKIIGPLSTFSRWASFYGEVPMRVLEKGNLKVKNEQFSILKSLYMCENGHKFTNWTAIEEKDK